MKFWMDDRLRMDFLKEKKAYRDFWKEYGAKKILAADLEIREYYTNNTYSGVDPDPNCPATKVRQNFINCLSTFKIWFDTEFPIGEDLKVTLDVLNPFREELPDNLPFHFNQDSPVAQLVDFTDDPLAALKGDITPEHYHSTTTDIAINKLQPWERLLRLDLRRSKKDIIDDVNLFIDRVMEYRKQPVGWADNYKKWEPDVSRNSKKASRTLPTLLTNLDVCSRLFRLTGKTTPPTVKYPGSVQWTN